MCRCETNTLIEVTDAIVRTEFKLNEHGKMEVIDRDVDTQDVIHYECGECRGFLAWSLDKAMNILKN